MHALGHLFAFQQSSKTTVEYQEKKKTINASPFSRSLVEIESTQMVTATHILGYLTAK